jgi:hypothetical protein
LRGVIAILGAALIATSASAAERTYSVTDFDRIVVDGPFGVTVKTGPAVSARASGDQRAIDRIAVVVANRTLRISRDKSAWGGWPGGGEGRAEIAVTVPALAGAMLGGSGGLSIDRMTGAKLALSLAGTGALRVDRIEADTLALSLTGSGALRVAGRAKEATASQRGSGAIAGEELVVEDLKVSASGSGSVALAATRSATIVASGAGVATVTGPAACTVKSSGSGVVTCGD